MHCRGQGSGVRGQGPTPTPQYSYGKCLRDAGDDVFETLCDPLLEIRSARPVKCEIGWHCTGQSPEHGHGGPCAARQWREWGGASGAIACSKFDSCRATRGEVAGTFPECRGRDQLGIGYGGTWGGASGGIAFQAFDLCRATSYGGGSDGAQANRDRNRPSHYWLRR